MPAHDHPSSYLALLARGLRLGLSTVPAERRERHAEAVQRSAVGNQGYRGRRGGADLYYTAFAVRALHALDRLAALDRESLQISLVSQAPVTIIDVVSLLQVEVLLGGETRSVAARLAAVERLRTEGGGYAKTPGGMASVYHSFLAILCYDLAGVALPQRGTLLAFIRSRQRPDGGFAETEGASQGTTNATAAALGALRVLQGEDAGARARACGFLLSMQHASGGWLAVPRAPVPDLLSTFTALVALDGSGRVRADQYAQARAFAQASERADGGFAAGPWDAEVDVEYTYYGLGVQGLCLMRSPSPEGRTG